MTYQDLIYKLQTGERFDFSRWGDGEWACLLQSRPGKANCDGHKYFRDLGEALKGVLASSPKYYIGLQSLAHRLYTEDIDAMTAAHNLKWCQANILHRANQKGRIGDLFEVLNDLDPLSPDTDNDGWGDAYEVEYCLSPNNPDTDFDGIPDGIDWDPKEHWISIIAPVSILGIALLTLIFGVLKHRIYFRSSDEE